MALGGGVKFVVGFLMVVLLSFFLTPFLGQNFFPPVEAGQIKLHVRAQTGTRIEETGDCWIVSKTRSATSFHLKTLDNIVDNIGLPISGINAAYGNSGTIGSADADVLISLREGEEKGVTAYVRTMRERLPELFPGTTFAFLPADIVTQILNFGLPAPIDVQVIGSDIDANRAYADRLLRRIALVNGVADARIQQAFNAPTLNVAVDRIQASQVGITERDVATSLQDTLAGSIQTAPTFWLNPKNGVSYPIVVQSPQYWADLSSSLENTPASAATSAGSSEILGGMATVTRGPSAAVVSHYAVQPVIDIFATNNERDLGAVSADIEKILHDTANEAPRGSTIVLRGQTSTMTTAYTQLYEGLALAIVLIYLLIVVNFQSWIDPFVIVCALPTALAGIVWMLFITGTTLSVPALTGAIMCMGVATANSILVVSFARERLAEGADALTAAVDAGFGRFRPVLMTALAMIIGMAPMALSAEQNAPLGRAVIGGLICSTIATLFFVPVVFKLVHSRVPRSSRTDSSASSTSIVPRMNELTPMNDADKGDLTSSQPRPTGPRRRRPKIGRLLVFLGLVALVIAFCGVFSRKTSDAKLEQWTRSAGCANRHGHKSSAWRRFTRTILPGDVEAYYSAPIHAQVSGYVKTWKKDIGAKVKAGDILAEIDTPEIDQQIAQAKEELTKAKSNQSLALITAKRWTALRTSNAVSQQAADEKESDANAKNADVAAAQANLDRVKAQKDFANIVAPFDGVVTARNIDVGALVNSSTTGSNSDLFSVADVHEMRVYVKCRKIIRPNCTPE